MRFYLNNKNNEIKVRVAPQITETQDESLDTVKCIVEMGDMKDVIAPMQKFILTDDNGNDTIFLVATDSVSLASTNPIKYVHELTLIQNTKFLEKKLIRNTVFSQPASPYKKCYFAQSFDKLVNIYWRRYEEAIDDSFSKFQLWEEKVIIEKEERVKNSYLIARMYAIRNSNFGLESDFSLFNGAWSVVVKAYVDGVVIAKHTISSTSIDKFNEKIELEEDVTDFINTIRRSFTTKVEISCALEYEPSDKVANATMMTFQCELYLETYYYTVYDVVNTLLEQQRKETSRYLEVTKLFNINQEMGEFLDSFVAPNFTFTQTNFYEALAEIFQLFDAIFTLDENNNLGIEYLNDKNKAQLSANFTGKNKGISEERFNRNIISYYQNAIVQDKFPYYKKQTDVGAFAPVRASVLGVPENINDYQFVVAHDIDQLLSISMYIRGAIRIRQSYVGSQDLDYTYYNCNETEFSLDITPFVIEYSLWTMRRKAINYPDGVNTPGTWLDFLDLNQCAFMTYNKGTKGINLAVRHADNPFIERYSFIDVFKGATNRFFGFGIASTWRGAHFGFEDQTYPDTSTSIPAWNSVFLKCEYITKIDGKIKLESDSLKYDGDIITNQGNGAVDLYKLGLNIYGLSFKMGEPTFAISHEITSWSDRIRKGQIYVDDNNDTWVANVCTYTIYNDKIMGNIEFSKNYNALSQRIKINREKRLSNISTDLTLKAEENYNEYIYISSVKDDAIQEEEICFSKSALFGFLKQTFGVDDGKSVDYIAFNSNEMGEFDNVYIPYIKYASGNAVCFETSFNSPISAGNKTTSEQGFWGEDKYFTEVVPYTNETGFFDTCTLTFMGNTSNTGFDEDFPSITQSKMSADTQLGQLPSLLYIKKPNEIFALNYSLLFFTIPSMKQKEFIGQSFVKESGFIKEVGSKKFYLYYSHGAIIEKYSLFDTKGIGSRQLITSITVDENDNSITFNIANITPTRENWSICDEEGNIYFASNNLQSGNTLGIKLYFVSKHYRI